MRRICLIIFFALFLLALPGALPRAQARRPASAADLLAAVNALRADVGLPAYTQDADLMASAQTHSDYQASIGEAAHTRADGSTPADLGFTENIASGYNLGAQTVVDTFWADDLHRSTLIGISEGFAGAGMAERDGVLYYTLQVRRKPGAVFVTMPAPAGGPTAASLSGTQPGAGAPALQTASPAANGEIIHRVQAGESLWAIALAYDVSVANLVGLNNLEATPVIYAGQKLVIRQAYTATVTPTITHTPRPPTRTPAPTRTPRPPTLTPTRTLTPSLTPFNPVTALVDLPQRNRRIFGIGLIVVCGIGLALVILGGLRPGPRR